MTLEEVKERLDELGYEIREGDDVALLFCIGKVEEHIKNFCNITKVPKELYFMSIDMACGEFLKAKLATGGLDGYGIADNRLIKSISEGDTSVAYSDVKTDAYTAMDGFIKGLIGNESDLYCFRRLRW